MEFAALDVRTERARGSQAEPTVPGECEGGVCTPTWLQEMRFPSSTGRLLSWSPVKALGSENGRSGSHDPALLWYQMSLFCNDLSETIAIASSVVRVDFHFPGLNFVLEPSIVGICPNAKLHKNQISLWLLGDKHVCATLGASIPLSFRIAMHLMVAPDLQGPIRPLCP